jgi:hypothetical protein
MAFDKAWGTFIRQYKDGILTEHKYPLLWKNFICEDIEFVSEKEIYFTGWMNEGGGAPRVGKMIKWNGSKFEGVKLPEVAKEWILFDLEMQDGKYGWLGGFYWRRNEGILMENKKGVFEALGKKEQPQIEGNWRVNSIQFDGKSWWATGENRGTHKGAVLKMTPK